MRMHNPPHPGEVLKSLCLEPLDLSVTETAKALKVTFSSVHSFFIKTIASSHRLSGATPIRTLLESPFFS
jgi:plasmid maintenance system antidote protein VapI